MLVSDVVDRGPGGSKVGDVGVMFGDQVLKFVKVLIVLAADVGCGVCSIY